VKPEGKRHVVQLQVSCAHRSGDGAKGDATLRGVVWPGTAGWFGHFDLIRIFCLTSPGTFDSLQWWLFCGHIVVGKDRLGTRREGWREGGALGERGN